MPKPSKLIFLPGAGGKKEFWKPVSDLIKYPAKRVLMGWPGFGGNPIDPNVNGIDDLVEMVVSELDQPSVLIAQSMGGVIAMKAALRKPEFVTHLVLSATSGGLDVSDLRIEDWRPAFLEANPTYPSWFTDHKSDLTPDLESVLCPVLLLWGDFDPISPVAVGERLKGLLPNARMYVLKAGTHDFVNRLAPKVAPLIEAHINEMF